MSRLVVIGAGGHGREIVEAILASVGSDDDGDAHDLIGVLADEADHQLLDALGTRHLGVVDDDVGDLVDAGSGYVIGIGSPAVRSALAPVFDQAGLVATSVVHPSASVGGAVRHGGGCYLAMGSRVTTNVVLGVHVHVNVNAVVSHDCTVGDFATLSPGVLVNGTCRIGRRAFFGTGSVVLPGLTIGDDAVVGAGAVVTADVAPGVTVVGVPARPVRP